MANPTPTLRQFLHSCGGDDVINIGGVDWRAQQLLEYLIQRNDARLSENVIEAPNGALSLYAAGMGAADATSPTVKAKTHKNTAGR